MSFRSNRRDSWLEETLSFAALVATAGLALTMMSRSVAVAGFRALVHGRHPGKA